MVLQPTALTRTAAIPKARVASRTEKRELPNFLMGCKEKARTTSYNRSTLAWGKRLNETIANIHKEERCTEEEQICTKTPRGETRLT